jgi:Ala-tRNA(Pro) deacylase
MLAAANAFFPNSARRLQLITSSNERSSIMNVTEFLTRQHVTFDTLDHPAAYDAQHLAQVLHVPGREVAKTVLLKANGGYRFFVAVLPATKRIDFTKASAVLGGSKLELATELEVADHCPDCECGVLPPFGSQYGMLTLVDENLTKDTEIVFEGNTHRDAIRMKFEDFRRIEEPLIVELTP